MTRYVLTHFQTLIYTTFARFHQNTPSDRGKGMISGEFHSCDPFPSEESLIDSLTDKTCYLCCESRFSFTVCDDIFMRITSRLLSDRKKI